ncbi:MAG: hypothetical protein ACI3YH_00180 [Eubacteriales bacterium]
MLTGCNLNKPELETYVDDQGQIIVVDGEKTYVSGSPDDPNVKEPTTGTTDINNPGTTNEPDTTSNPKHYDTFVPNPDFSVDEENITASQILANLDEMTLDFAEMSLYGGLKIDREELRFIASFTSLAPEVLKYIDDEPLYNTIAPLELQTKPQHIWFRVEGLPYYGANTESINGYYTTLNYYFSKDNRPSNKTIRRLIMPKEEYSAMLDAFGVQKHILDYNEYKDNPLFDYWMAYIDTEVYDAFTLDR